MSAEENKVIVGRWFTEFWGERLQPGGHRRARGARHPVRVLAPRAVPRPGRGACLRHEVPGGVSRPEFSGRANLIAEGDYVVGQWEGGGTQTGDAFDDMPIGTLPAGTGKTMHFSGITVLKVEDGLICEELGLDDGVTVLQQLGLI